MVNSTDSLTVEEIAEILKERIDPDLLIELLDISTEDLVNSLMDYIENKMPEVVQYLRDTTDGEEIDYAD